MAFDSSAAGGYGSGSLGDVTNPAGQINTYAQIQVNGTYSAYLTGPLAVSEGMYHTLEDSQGVEVLLHMLTSPLTDLLGLWRVCKITKVAVNDGGYLEFTFNKSVSDFQRAGLLQLITIPHFKNLTINAGTYYRLMPEAGNGYTHAPQPGGVLAFKCSDTFTLANASLDLRGKGFYYGANTPDSRALTAQESHVLDSALQAGHENSITKDRLLVNCGDGACFIMAKNISTSGTARIGDPECYGVQYCRGAEDSPNTPSKATNLGGSTIFIACGTWSGFSPQVISKYRTIGSGSPAGRGLARAYLSVNTLSANILPDDGLYTLDVPSVRSQPHAAFHLSGFGDGHNTGSIGQKMSWNAYGAVSAISDDGLSLTYTEKHGDNDAAVAFEAGNMVMVHQTQRSAGNDINNGKFILAKIVSCSGSTLTLNYPFTADLSKYYVQVVVIPQLSNFTLTGTYQGTLPWTRGAGGICAVACSGTFNITGATIDTEGRGTFLNNRNCLMGNRFLRGRLPIGQGHGSIFILAKTLKMSSSTRLGGTYSGNAYGGKAMKSFANNTPTYTASGGWRGADGTSEKYPEYIGTGGHGGGAGTNSDGYNGGWFSNASYALDYEDGAYGCQGAHIMILADSIDGLNLGAISTGGKCGISDAAKATTARLGDSGGAGYGGAGYSTHSGTTNFRFAGAGGYRGGGGGTTAPTSAGHLGGGASGACFIYCNSATNYNQDGIVTS